MKLLTKENYKYKLFHNRLAHCIARVIHKIKYLSTTCVTSDVYTKKQKSRKKALSFQGTTLYIALLTTKSNTFNWLHCFSTNKKQNSTQNMIIGTKYTFPSW